MIFGNICNLRVWSLLTSGSCRRRWRWVRFLHAEVPPDSVGALRGAGSRVRPVCRLCLARLQLGTGRVPGWSGGGGVAVRKELAAPVEAGEAVHCPWAIPLSQNAAKYAIIDFSQAANAWGEYPHRVNTGHCPGRRVGFPRYKRRMHEQGFRADNVLTAMSRSGDGISGAWRLSCGGAFWDS